MSAKQENFIEKLGELMQSMGWVIAIPDKNAVDHLIVGKEETIISLVQNTNKTYEIMTPPKESDSN